MTDKQTTRRPWATWSKKKKLGVLGGVPLALVALPAAAAAIFAALAGIQGGGATGTFTAQWKSQGMATDTSALVSAPSMPATVTAGKLNLPAGLVMFPGESFTIRASVTDAGSTADGYVSGIVMPGMPAGYVAELVTGCGGDFPSYDTQEVTLKISAAAEQADGVSWTLAPEAGVQVSLGDKPAGVVCAPYVAE